LLRPSNLKSQSRSAKIIGLRTYLYALDGPDVSPCYRDDDAWDYVKQTIGETAYRIPLPWLAMFRLADLREVWIPIDEEGSTEKSIAPLTTMVDAKKHLLEAREVVRRAFPQCPLLGSYFETMVEELSLFDFPYVTIGATQLYPEIIARGEFSHPWEAVLSGFTSPAAAAEYVPLSFGDRVGRIFGRARQDPWLKAINNFVEFSPDQSLPLPDYRRRGVLVSAEEESRHAVLLPGGEYHTSVWNPERPTKRGKEIPPG
jgi:hypothetical protein